MVQSILPETFKKDMFLAIFICDIFYMFVGVWGVSPTGKSYSLRSCVRACEAACARETMLLPRLGGGSLENPLGRGRARALCLSVGYLIS